MYGQLRVICNLQFSVAMYMSIELSMHCTCFGCIHGHRCSNAATSVYVSLESKRSGLLHTFRNVIKRSGAVKDISQCCQTFQSVLKRCRTL